MTDPDDDLAERVAELESSIEELRDELREPPRGPLGLPRPPSPGDVLRFADEFAIPTVIAVLEANLRALRLLQRVLRASRGVEESETRERAVDLGRESLARLDDALSDLSTAMEDADLPREPESRRLLEDVRELNKEIRGRLEPSSEEDEEVTMEESVRVEKAENETEIDVEAELDSIRREVRGNGEDGEEGGEHEDTDEDEEETDPADRDHDEQPDDSAGDRPD